MYDDDSDNTRECDARVERASERRYFYEGKTESGNWQYPIIQLRKKEEAERIER